MEKTDLLQAILDHQEGLNNETFKRRHLGNGTDAAFSHVSTLPWTSPELHKWLRNYIMATQVELGELLEETAYKWWKDTEVQVEPAAEKRRKACVELIDVLHFVFSIALLLDLDAQDIYNIYKEKAAVNSVRLQKPRADGDDKHVAAFKP